LTEVAEKGKDNVKPVIWAYLAYLLILVPKLDFWQKLFCFRWENQYNFKRCFQVFPINQNYWKR